LDAERQGLPSGLVISEVNQQVTMIAELTEKVDAAKEAMAGGAVKVTDPAGTSRFVATAGHDPVEDVRPERAGRRLGVDEVVSGWCHSELLHDADSEVRHRSSDDFRQF
jgi:hypothetical protein